MTKEEILEGNKLIAEFMGIKIIDDYSYYDDGRAAYCNDHVWFFNDEYYFGEMGFNESWDWLMPVVEKIESLSVTTEIACRMGYKDNEGQLYCCEFLSYGWGEDIRALGDARSKIQAVYNCVIDFIQQWCVENRIACYDAGYPAFEAMYDSISEFYKRQIKE